MKILTSSTKLCEKVFPEANCFEIPIDPVFDQFEWNDLNCTQPLCFELRNSGGDPVFNDMECGIIEEFSGASQFDRLRNWQGPAIFALAIDGQGFHGQHQRIWRTGTGNLYLSMAIPVALPVSCAQAIQLIPAQLIADELNRHYSDHIHAGIKAPNDVVICLNFGSSFGILYKIAGTLTEMRVNSDRITQVRYGIGMNLMQAPGQTDPGHLPAIAVNDIDPYGNIDNRFRSLQYCVPFILSGILTKMYAGNSMAGSCENV